MHMLVFNGGGGGGGKQATTIENEHVHACFDGGKVVVVANQHQRERCLPNIEN